MWINYLKFGALYKGSSLQIMTPLHSLPMGCVCNFLEYKSCIIHVNRRATSINYVSLLGARVFTTSSFFSLILLPLFLLLSSLLNHDGGVEGGQGGFLGCDIPSAPRSYCSVHGGQMDRVQLSTRGR